MHRVCSITRGSADLDKIAKPEGEAAKNQSARFTGDHPEVS